VPAICLRLAALAAALIACALAPAPPAYAATDDPLLAEQWWLADGAREAWTQTQGEGAVVAILDSGVQLDHPDLAANLWTNPGETAGNGVDDDRNGFVDDVHGANLFDRSGNAGDDQGHGTHIAGIVAAAAANGAGGSGLAPKARIMAVKVMDAHSVSDSSLVARGIHYAVDEGARIINISLNGDESTPSLDEAIVYAGARGATIVASAGNDSRDTDLLPSFPAASVDPAVLSVTASRRDGGLLAFANRGLRSVDLAAPGERILSTARSSRYELRSGTSMAAPYVCAALALLASARPDLDGALLRETLRATARRGPGLLGLLSSGEVDVAAAIHAILPGVLWRATPSAGDPSQRPRLRVSAAKQVRSGATATVRWSATGARSVARWTIELDGRRVATRRASARVLRKRLRAPGRHRWRVLARDAAGVRIATASRSFRVVKAR
jgi:subtilisin family serine protease